MKRGFSRCRVIVCPLLAAMVFCSLAGCDKMGVLGKKQSYAEGKVVDWDGKPLAGVKITATQMKPLKGYERVEAITNGNGAFKLSGLCPLSTYTIALWSDQWQGGWRCVVGNNLEARYLGRPLVSATDGATALIGECKIRPEWRRIVKNPGLHHVSP